MFITSQSNYNQIYKFIIEHVIKIDFHGEKF